MTTPATAERIHPAPAPTGPALSRIFAAFGNTSSDQTTQPVTGSLQVPDTGAYDRWADVESDPVRLPAGDVELRLVAETDSFNLNFITVEPSPAD